MFFISPAYAQAAPPQQQAGMSPLHLLMMVGLFATMWFVMIRPQQKRAKEHKAMLDSLKRGDEVLTNGGLMGRVLALNEQAVDLEVAKGTVIRMQRPFITQVLPKGSLKGDLASKAANDESDSKEEKK